jgi:PEP-CTERM motif
MQPCNPGLLASLVIAGWLGFAAPSRADTIGFITSHQFIGPSEVEYLTSFGHDVRTIFVATPNRDAPDLTLADLAGVDTLLIASDVPFGRPAALGDVAAAFADSGRGVVLAEFTFQQPWALSGRIMSTGYSPFTIDPNFLGNPPPGSHLGFVALPGSRLFTGVNMANVTDFWQADVHLTPGSTLVAQWDTGRPAFAFNALRASNVVALNLDPRAEFTNDPDTQRLVSNALLFASSSSPSSQTPEPGTMLLVGIGAVTAVWRRGASAFPRTHLEGTR